MKEKPILFSTEMVQAILDGRKTQTRRVVKPRSYISDVVDGVPLEVTEDDLQPITPPYGEIGDILWVRETWNECGNFVASCCHNSEAIAYKTRHAYWVDWDGFFNELDTSDWAWEGMKWKPSIHMPKDAARIWLKVTGVRCERLQDISEGDAIAEGLFPIDDERIKKWQDYLNAIKKGYFHDPRLSFWTLWKSIYGPDSWMENPWVWVYEFEVLSTTGKP